MPDYTTYPSADDIEVLLKSIAVWPVDTTAQAFAREEAAACASAAWREWERRTGWLPFLSTGSDTTRNYLRTDSYGNLVLDAGLITLTSVILTYDYQTNQENVTLVQGVDFVLQDLNAAAQGVPYTQVKFRREQFAYTQVNNWNNIAVTGKFGYALTVPEDVWSAICRHGADRCLSSLQTMPNMTSISQDGFSKSQDVPDSITQRAILAEWGKNFNRLATLYTRVI